MRIEQVLFGEPNLSGPRFFGDEEASREVLRNLQAVLQNLSGVNRTSRCKTDLEEAGNLLRQFEMLEPSQQDYARSVGVFLESLRPHH